MRRWFWVIDAFVVVSFVLIGRDSHGFNSDVGDIVKVAAPFLIALALGCISRRRPTLALAMPLASPPALLATAGFSLL